MSKRIEFLTPEQLERVRANKRASYQRHRTRILAENRAKYPERREQILIERKAYYARTTPARRAEKLRYHYKRRGVDISTVPLVRGEHCELCHAPGKICCDHNHASGKFRGWLCNRCNRVLGLLKDDPALLRRAADYLETR